MFNRYTNLEFINTGSNNSEFATIDEIIGIWPFRKSKNLTIGHMSGSEFWYDLNSGKSLYEYRSQIIALTAAANLQNIFKRNMKKELTND